MRTDVVDLRDFYATSLGQAARRLVEARFAAPKQTATMVARYEALRARRA